jgi:integron integrase
VRHYSLRTEDAYLDRVRRFVLSHPKRQPLEMGAAEIHRFLTHLAVAGDVAASTQDQAFSALLSLYQKVLAVDPGRTEGVIRAKRPRRVPVVLTRSEVRLVLARLTGTYRLIGQVLYGSGLRLLEGLRRRVKDLDFEQGEILVREGKGDKDRHTVLPDTLEPEFRRHREVVRGLHEQDLAKGLGQVYLPHALDRKLPGAAGAGCWQSVFPSAVLSVDPRSGLRRRHHACPTSDNVGRLKS